jgi:hypothetical protein
MAMLGSLLAIGCGSRAGAGPSGATPTASPASPSMTASSPSTSPSPRATGTPGATLDGLPFPTGDAVIVPPGRYASQPPFAVPFTFEVSGADWRTWHLIPEFLDIAKYDPSVEFFLPSRWLAFAQPGVVYGPSGEHVATGEPDEVVAAWAARDDLVTSETEPFELGGLAGVRVDLHAAAAHTAIFGGDRGDLGMQPELDARVGIVPYGKGVLLVLSLAPAAELDDAWVEAAPIVASVSLPGR